MEKAPLRILISGGGTGGHIHPAIAIAEGIQAQQPDAQIEFVGALGRMEMERIPAAGYTITGLPITGIDRKLSRRNLGFPWRLIRSLILARRIIQRFQPDVAVGVGGFASGPLLWMASKAGIPTLIQEQNGFPGITNRLLAKRVHKVCAGFPGLDKWFPSDKITETGNPLRRSIVERLEQSQHDATNHVTSARAHFGLREDKPVLLVLGGSLGAASMNAAVRQLASSGPLAKKGFRFCGNAVAGMSKSMWNGPMRTMTPSLWSAASSTGWIWRMTRPPSSPAGLGPCRLQNSHWWASLHCWFPSPHVAEDHQTKNARSVVDRQGAIMLPDDRVVRDLGQEVRHLLNDAEGCATMSKALRAAARPKAATTVANAVIELAHP